VYWSHLLRKWHNVIDDEVKTHQMVARTQAQSAWAGFVNMMLERLRCETHWHFCGATTFGVVSVCH
jgi:hypothetical protein